MVVYGGPQSLPVAVPASGTRGTPKNHMLYTSAAAGMGAGTAVGTMAAPAVVPAVVDE